MISEVVHMVRNRIRHWRQQLGMTVIEFAALCGVHPGQVSRWENHATEPSVPVYWRLWQRLRQQYPDMHLEDLIEPVSAE
jgi:DNA-binding XRE family transcriptional regulator